ncbi:SDR family oxidoreductase [Paenibacillus qinlingensis]|uniref:NAD(P)-dependent dehydrogenase (Short-subunit alcohol dehydrogenase family) n=1 Tax=Paenibacillus qinlingensis TaxID=1837343 RepID=A0ABU1P0B8_9BACL|nr:SDR family oxidoreductase [Paenibacillus qinlingensis]MDR6553197.1 NAD(P)-dependent dehydrogenase (short-subunit alcohol dehydrogenase family) [Paenibacillus qinlingensis]
MRFEQKVFIVTGGGTGIGRATSIRLAQEGANVVIANRSEANAMETLEQMKDSAGKAIFVKTDVGQSTDIQRVIQTAVETFGRLDGIVHSAAVESLLGVVDLSEEEWHATLNVNLTSAFLLGKYGIPHMINSGGGVIINVASVHAQATINNYAAYAASKGGLMALTRSMAIDYAKQGIRVNAVLPGATDTGMLNRYAELGGLHGADLNEEWKGAQPLGRIGKPEEIANVICFIASDEARFMIGTGVVIDGGMLAEL